MTTILFTIFLRDVTCFNRIQGILKLLEDTSNLKIIFSKTKPYGLQHKKDRIDPLGQMEWSKFKIKFKILGVKEPSTNNFRYA